MKLLRYLLVILVCLMMIFPILFVILGATNNSGWAFTSPIRFIVGNQLITNLDNIGLIFDVPRVVFNSIWVAFLTSIISLLVTFFAAYAFSKYEFKFKKILYTIFVASVFIPGSAILIGQLKTMNLYGVYGTILGLIVPFIINIRVFVYLNNICSYIPNDVIEAARIDGASEARLITYISVPLVKDKLYFSFFMLFVASWNNFLIPMITINTKNKFTIPVMVSSLADPLRYDVGSTFLALVISVVPIIILFGLFNKKVFNEYLA